ncbi:hypothetical protein X474_00125 [Dethiosulfatarculus sandiegensis]|uniref:Uncharacterized protein n=1 Tax=Dethiosulfatarculus sandiegensis TaxID=1429043 RepID=A0A0D2JK77_9BACT|nr:hypothetical protein X474_00125 [Dethiosulfatarculus sandiegensis]
MPPYQIKPEALKNLQSFLLKSLSSRLSRAVLKKGPAQNGQLNINAGIATRDFRTPLQKTFN